MKKLYAVVFLMLLFFGFSRIQAQMVDDFEYVTMNLMQGGAEDLSSFALVANPDKTGANTSPTVCKFVRDKDGVPWGGFWSRLGAAVDVTTNKYVHIKVWKSRISPVKFKLEGGEAGTLEVASMNPQTLTNAWEELVFDFSSKTGTYPVIAFMPDFIEPVNLNEDIIIYFDDITFNNDPAVGSTPAYVLEDYEHIPLNYLLGGAEDQSSMSIVENPDKSGVNKSPSVVKFVRDKDGVPWGGFWSNLPTPVDVTTNKYVHVKVWKPRQSPIKFKLEGGTAGTLELPAANYQEAMYAWQDMVFDFSSKTGTYPIIAFLPDFADPVSLTSDITIYFDDILVNNDPNPIIPSSLEIRVNMMGSGLAAGEKVWIAGSFGGDYGTWASPGSNANNEMTDPDADSLYSIALNVPAGTYQFKFFKGTGWNGGEWAGDPNRIATVTIFTPLTYKWGDKSSGIEEIPFNKEVKAYPVPFNNELTLFSPVNIETVVIYSSFGQKMARLDNVPPGPTKVDVTNYASGLYFVTFYGKNGERVTRKVIKE